ncbi:hypothetical protein, partial [Prescottella equi]|uniref:hypothetical protein n=1 Tax=Rhodococcus hoagii TaxID=43767 RepID=UPI003F68B8F1
ATEMALVWVGEGQVGWEWGVVEGEGVEELGEVEGMRVREEDGRGVGEGEVGKGGGGVGSDGEGEEVGWGVCVGRG